MWLVVSIYRSVYHTLAKNKLKEDIRLVMVEKQHLLDVSDALQAEEDRAGEDVTQSTYYLPQ